MLNLDAARACTFCRGTALVSPGGMTRPCPHCQRNHYPPRAARAQEPTPMTRTTILLALLATGCGSSAAMTGATAALKTATVVVDGAREVRRYLCHRALDPLLGDPRAAEASSGGSAPAPTPAAPPPEVPAPALPPIPVPAPRVEGDAGLPNDAAAPAGMDGGL